MTIDRTGLSWGELVSRLLLEEMVDENESQATPEDKTTASRHLNILRRNLQPQQMASILHESWVERTDSLEGGLSQLVTTLQALLYKRSGSWQSGALVRNIIRLAASYLQLGRNVVIATTNYDVYIEEGFTEYQKEIAIDYKGSGEQAPKRLDNKVTALSKRGTVKIKGKESAGRQLELVYLHGRIPREGSHKGRLVLSERDYHSAHDNVSDQLKKLFSINNAGLLILGSSLTDPPLLSALAATYQRDRRYALIPAQSTGIVATDAKDYQQLCDYVRQRGKHFGVEFLVPDFHFQIAQFCEEILTAVGLDPEPKSYLNDKQGIRYGLRLVAWWERWQSTCHYQTPEKVHEQLVRGVESIRTLLSRSQRHDGTSTENLKIELWVREDPRAKRNLTLWGTSAGTLDDRSLLRSEELKIGSGNASVRAFVEGRPQYVSQETLMDELAYSADALPWRSRWRSFLSVPIRIDYSPKELLVGLPVGVVTLASMYNFEDSDIPYRESRRMEELVRILVELGQTLLWA